jgi:uncharacterized membrane protein YedE/YeeE
VLSWATFLFMNKALGASTTMARLAGVAEGVVAPQHVQDNPYFAKYLVGKPAFEWQMALVLTSILGAFLAARLFRTPRPDAVPSIWAARFGSSRPLRYAAAFIGGAIMLYGARLAGGCTSGHGISGGLQLAVSGWLFFAATFIAGITAAFVLYGGKGRQHV